MSDPTLPVLEARDLTKRFGDTQALGGVSMSIPAGTICAVLGHNGAGKTTMIRCALGLTDVTSGQISVLGQPAGSLSARQRIGAMLQDVDLPDLLTGREQLELYASYYQTPADIDAVIERADIGAFADQRYKKLSGGQKRRVQFAVALIGQPALLFLDEPTTGLDTDARRAVWANVRSLADAGTSVILTTHYLEEADALADRIIVVSNGLIIADDTTTAIRARVGGAIISGTTSLAQAALDTLPGITSATLDTKRRCQLLSDDTNASVSALLQADPSFADLAVRKPTLEEAFSTLTQTTPTMEATA